MSNMDVILRNSAGQEEEEEEEYFKKKKVPQIISMKVVCEKRLNIRLL